MIAMATRRVDPRQAALPLAQRGAEVTDNDLRRAYRRTEFYTLGISFSEATEAPELLACLRLIATATGGRH